MVEIVVVIFDFFDGFVYVVKVIKNCEEFGFVWNFEGEFGNFEIVIFFVENIYFLVEVDFVFFECFFLCWFVK